ncbi:hypothetical protein V8C42DRAFT_323205 [Trichoderma barbatum]
MSALRGRLTCQLFSSFVFWSNGLFHGITSIHGQVCVLVMMRHYAQIRPIPPASASLSMLEQPLYTDRRYI